MAAGERSGLFAMGVGNPEPWAGPWAGHRPHQDAGGHRPRRSGRRGEPGGGRAAGRSDAPHVHRCVPRPPRSRPASRDRGGRAVRPRREPSPDALRPAELVLEAQKGAEPNRRR